jgi:anti-sigma factor RsiW
MTCQELVELVTEYLDGALPPRDRERFEEHLATCPGCEAHLTQVRETIGVLGHVPPEALSERAERDLLAAFRNWKRR